MRKIIVSMWITLDGFVAGPDDGMNWLRGDDEMMAYEISFVEKADILMLGRQTFGDFAGHWADVARGTEATSGKPSLSDEMQRNYARRVDEMKKIVVSKSGKVAEWKNSEMLTKIVEEDIGRVKRGSGGYIAIYGSLSVIDALSDLGLIDEYQLLVHPTFVGKGVPLFSKKEPVNLELVSMKRFKSGVVVMNYRPVN